MKLTFLGSGTSHGVPVIACNCDVCNSENPKDKRFRASVLVENDDTTVLIDVGPDFRSQALRQKIRKIDAVLLTHGHADHLNGIDDLRIFSNTVKIGEPLNIYGNDTLIADLKTRFSYAFKNTQQGGGKPVFSLHDTKDYSDKNPIVIKAKNGKPIYCTPIPLLHGVLSTCGFVLKADCASDACSADATSCRPNDAGSTKATPCASEACSADATSCRPNDAAKKNGIAYITDCNYISESSLKMLQDVDCLIIDALRDRPHSTHFTFNESLEIAAKVAANRTYFTHICHDFSHDEICKILNERKMRYPALRDKIVEPAFDELVIVE